MTAAALLTVVLCLIGLAILLQLNWLAVGLGASSLLLVAAYPFMKRITWWPQAWLGLTFFNWGALAGFSRQRPGGIESSCRYRSLYAGLFFWTLGYDTIYAHQDKEDDALIGVKSTARLLGADSRKWILRFYAVSFTLVLTAGFIDHIGWSFAFVMLAAGAHLVWQTRRLNIDDPDNCLRLFRSNREAGGLIALAFALAAWFGMDPARFAAGEARNGPADHFELRNAASTGERPDGNDYHDCSNMNPDQLHSRQCGADATATGAGDSTLSRHRSRAAVAQDGRRTGTYGRAAALLGLCLGGWTSTGALHSGSSRNRRGQTGAGFWFR